MCLLNCALNTRRGQPQKVYAFKDLLQVIIFDDWATAVTEFQDSTGCDKERRHEAIKDLFC